MVAEKTFRRQTLDFIMIYTLSNKDQYSPRVVIEEGRNLASMVMSVDMVVEFLSSHRRCTAFSDKSCSLSLINCS